MKITEEISLSPRLPVINKKLVPVKMGYLIFLAALGCAIPFRTVFAKQLGLSGSESGVILSFVPFMKIITNPMFGAVLDKFKRFRLTLIVILIIVAFSHTIMVILPSVAPDPDNCIFKTKLKHYCNDTTTKFCIMNTEMKDDVRVWNISCNFQCCSCSSNNEKEHGEEQCRQQNMSIASQTITLITSKNKTEEELVLDKNTDWPYIENQLLPHFPCLQALPTNCTSEVCFKYAVDGDGGASGVMKEFTSYQFWCLLILNGFACSTFAAVLFIMDAVCYEILDNQTDKYGYQRLWGAMGWGIGTLLGGYANMLATADSSVPNYKPCFYLLAVLCIVDIIPVSFLKVENVKFSDNIFKDVGQLLCNIYILIYVIMALVVGLLSGLIWNYQLWFLEEMGASPLLSGLSMTTESFLAEVPCFIISGWVIKKIGHINCVSLAFLCFGLRYLCFAYMKDPWLSIPLALLHGPTFGIYFASVTTFGKENAPPGTEATVQALLAVSFEGVGVAAGCLLGGLGFDTLGSRNTFWYAGVTSFVFLVINVLLQLLLKNFKPRNNLNKTGLVTRMEVVHQIINIQRLPRCMSR